MDPALVDTEHRDTARSRDEKNDIYRERGGPPHFKEDYNSAGCPSGLPLSAWSM